MAKKSVEEKIKDSIGDDLDLLKAVEGGAEDLPPAGAKREEVKAMREDILQEQIGLREIPGGHFKFDPSTIERDREILHDLDKYDEFAVSKAQSGFDYVWEWTGKEGRNVFRRKAQGWQVVSGSDPESREREVVDSTRRIGDVILLRIRKELHEKIKANAAQARHDQQVGGPGAELQDLGNRYADQGIKTYTDADEVEDLRRRAGRATPA